MFDFKNISFAKSIATLLEEESSDIFSVNTLECEKLEDSPDKMTNQLTKYYSHRNLYKSCKMSNMTGTSQF
jgi:hypothetical protein